MISLRWLAKIFLFLLPNFAFADTNLVAIPPLTNHVVDRTATLNTEQLSQLDENLREFEKRKGSQIAVLIVPSTQPEAIEQFSLRVAEQWKLGRKNVDDGAILVVAKNDRSLRIEVGYGLEGALNDAISKRIIEEVIVPYFKQDDFYGGISAGIQQIIKVVDGEPLAAAPQSGVSQDSIDFKTLFPLVLVAAMVVGGLLRALLGRLLGALVTSGIIGIVAWMVAGAIASAVIAAVIAFLLTLMVGGRAGVGGIYMGGGFGGGGLGGGGFSGGGGGFGGGGASGRW